MASLWDKPVRTKMGFLKQEIERDWQRDRETEKDGEGGEGRKERGRKKKFYCCKYQKSLVIGRVINEPEKLYPLLVLVNHQHPSSGSHYGTAARAAIGAQQPLVEAAHMEAIVALLASQNPAS